MKRFFAVLLVLALLFTCLPLTITAQEERTIPTLEKTRQHFNNAAAQKSARCYSPEDMVRVIVVLDGDGAAQSPKKDCAAAKQKVLSQQAALKSRLQSKQISYKQLFAYDTLLSGLAIEVAYRELPQLAALPGVKSVHISNRYSLPEAPAVSADTTTQGNTVYANENYRGEGMVIAVLDSGISANHEAFQVYEGQMTEAKLTEATVQACIEQLGCGVYLSEKLPFAYDYADKDNNPADDSSGHGTHVAAIAAGYAERGGETVFCGAAPAAQMLVMKVFSSASSNTTSDIYLKALEDAYTLGADTINMSFGAQNGLSYDKELESEVFGNVYDTLYRNGVVVCISAGNDGSMADESSCWAGTGFIPASNPDYGTLGAPASYGNNQAIASIACKNSDCADWRMSSFSSRGCSDDLTLKPQLAAPGSDISSAKAGTTNEYTLKSGTSMASPYAAGSYATLLQALPEIGLARLQKAEAIAQSTACILSDEAGTPYSPRWQGAGAMMLPDSATAYLQDPILSLGESEAGSYTLRLHVVNPTQEALTYQLTPVVLCDTAEEKELGGQVKKYNGLRSCCLTEGTDYIFNGASSLTVPAGGEKEISLTLTLTASLRAKLDGDFPNGTYMEGFILLDNAQHPIHATFMGFYGDWNAAPLTEQHDFREAGTILSWLWSNYPEGSEECYAQLGYHHRNAWQLGITDLEVSTDVNTAYLSHHTEEYDPYGYAGDNPYNWSVAYREEHITVSNAPPDEIDADELVIYPMTLRAARHVIMVVSNAQTGEIYAVDDTEYLPKAGLTFGLEVGAIDWGSAGVFRFDGRKSYGLSENESVPLPNNTEVNIDFYASFTQGEDMLGKIPYGSLAQAGAGYRFWSFPCTVDNEPPRYSYTYDRQSGILTLTATDNRYLSLIEVWRSDGSRVDGRSFSDTQPGETHTERFAVGQQDFVYLCCTDYATNGPIEKLVLSEENAIVSLHTPAGITPVGGSQFFVPTGTAVPLPDIIGNVQGYTFVGWVTEQMEGMWNEQIECWAPCENYTVRGNTDLYALFVDGAGICTTSPMGACAHQWARSEEQSTLATCTRAGLDVFICALCRECYTNTVEPLGHDWNAGILTIPPTETQTGLKTYTCNRCSTTKTEIVDALGHTHHFTPVVTPPTCTEAGYTTHSCTCTEQYKDTYTDALGHNWDEGKVTVKPTAVKSGVMTYTCTRCGETKTKELPATGEWTNPFIDVPAGKWYTDAVKFAVTNELFFGTSDNTFSPDGDMTRAMLVTVLWRLDGKTAPTGSNPFTDVPSGKWYTEAVIWAAENGVVTGVGNNKFNPDGNITREQMAAILYRYAAMKGYDTKKIADLSVFPDCQKVSDWARTALSWANAEGLINGSDGMLLPRGNASRAQVAAILMRYVNNIVS